MFKTTNPFNGTTANLATELSLTRPFHLDRASLFCRCARLGEQAALGTPPGGILLRDTSAAEQDNVTITFYQQCHHRLLTACGREQMALSSC